MAASSCSVATSKRRRCHRLYGERGEDCLVEELEEKRCLAFQYCPRHAQHYYETSTTTGKMNDENTKKGICALWAEAFCFADPVKNAMNQGDVELHAKARDYVNENPDIKRTCRASALDLAKCMQKYSIS